MVGYHDREEFRHVMMPARIDVLTTTAALSYSRDPRKPQPQYGIFGVALEYNRVEGIPQIVLCHAQEPGGFHSQERMDEEIQEMHRR